MMPTRHALLLGALLMLPPLVGCFGGTNEPGSLPVSTLTIGDDTFEVEVARSSFEIATGLMNRDPADFPSGRGMFFDLGDERTVSFFNANVRFDIDVAFIRADRTIARIVQLDAFDPTQRSSGEPVRWVLETRAGDLAQRGIGEGHVVVFSDELEQLVGN